MSCRSVMSNSNYDVLKNFAKIWFQTGWETSPTIGELYAGAKSNSKFSPSLNFFYAGDPAVRVPVATESIDLKLPEYGVPGSKLKLKGFTVDKNGRVESDFSGKGVLKIMKPLAIRQSLDYVTQTYLASSKDERDTLHVKYPSERLIAAEFEVNEGKFETEILLPKELQEYVGKELILHFSAYNPVARKGATAKTGLLLRSIEDAGTADYSPDTIAPVISARYNPVINLLEIDVQDDMALPCAQSAVELRIDGENARLVPSDVERMHGVGKRNGYTSDVINLAFGSHRAIITCSDLAGNRSNLEFDFIKEEEVPSLQLNVSSIAVVDSLTVEVEGTDNENVEITIVDGNRRPVLVNKVSGGKFAWNCRNEKGERVSPGLYGIKAIVRDGQGIRKYSKWETIAVLQ